MRKEGLFPGRVEFQPSPNVAQHWEPHPSEDGAWILSVTKARELKDQNIDTGITQGNILKETVEGELCFVMREPQLSGQILRARVTQYTAS